MWFDRIFASIDGVSVHIDDILVTADSIDQLIDRIERVLQRAAEWRVTLAAHKTQVTAGEMTILGATVGNG